MIRNNSRVFSQTSSQKISLKTPEFYSWLVGLMHFSFHHFFVRLVLPIGWFSFRRTSTGRRHLVKTFVIGFLVVKLEIVRILDVLLSPLWLAGLKDWVKATHFKTLINLFRIFWENYIKIRKSGVRLLLNWCTHRLPYYILGI